MKPVKLIFLVLSLAEASRIQQRCSGSGGVYFRRSCFVVNTATNLVLEEEMPKCELFGLNSGWGAVLPDMDYATALYPSLVSALVRVNIFREATSTNFLLGWYWLERDGTKINVPHSSLLWKTGEPNAATEFAGELTTGGVTGSVVSTNLNKNYICQYRDSVQYLEERWMRGNYTVHSATVQTKQACAGLCAQYLSCQAFSYGKGSGACHLHHVLKGHPLLTLIPDKSFNFFQMSLDDAIQL